IPYDRVPLSKEFVRWERPFSELFFRKESFYRQKRIELILGHKAISIDRKNKTVKLDDRRELTYSKLLLATGGKPRKLHVANSDLEGIYYLRTIDDSVAIRQRIHESKNAVVVGGGFIGCEVASSLTQKGLQTTIVEVMPHILGKAIDEKTSGWIKEYHEAKGTKIYTNTKVVGFEGEDGRVKGVRLDNGKTLAADMVVVGVGIELNVELASSAGLSVNNGVQVSDKLQSQDADIYVAGDIANFYSPLLQRQMRVEHYDVAEKHGTIAGSNMAGQDLSYDEPPYFFSDQYDLNINAFGDLIHHTEIISKEAMSKDGFIEYYIEGKKVVGILSVNSDWDDIEEAKAKIGRDREEI
ncbi:MAG: FAD-dependent oxidoreductase, partial [Conexivisphaerales archaeon]